MDLEAGVKLEKYLEKNNWEENAVREVMTDPIFIAFCYTFQKTILEHKKISIDFIREMRKYMRINWNYFMRDEKHFYTWKEKEKLRLEFKLIDSGFRMSDNWITNWHERN